MPDASDNRLAGELEQRLGEAGLRPTTTSAEAELDRLLRPAAPPRRRAAGKRAKPGTAGASLVDYLTKHVDRLAAEDLRVRRGEPDSVHQLRVAARRMRSALQSYRPLLDRERTDPLVDGSARARPRARPGPRRRGAARADPRRARGLGARAAARARAGAGHPALRARRGGGRARPCSARSTVTQYARLRRDLDDLLAAPAVDQARGAGRARKELPAHVGARRAAARPGRSRSRSIRRRPAERARPRRPRRPQGRQAAALRHRGGAPGGREGREAVREGAQGVPGRARRAPGHRGGPRSPARVLGAQAHADGGERFQLRRAVRPRRRPRRPDRGGAAGPLGAGLDAPATAAGSADHPRVRDRGSRALSQRLACTETATRVHRASDSRESGPRLAECGLRPSASRAVSARESRRECTGRHRGPCDDRGRDRDPGCRGGPAAHRFPAGAGARVDLPGAGVPDGGRGAAAARPGRDRAARARPGSWCGSRGSGRSPRAAWRSR